MRIAIAFIPAAALALSIATTSAQERKGIESVPLGTHPITGLQDKEMLMLHITLQPGGGSGLHTHPGDEYGTVIEGNVMVRIGRDGEFKPVTVGQTFSAPPNTPMEIRNTSDKPTKIINVFVIEKGKPRFTPAH